MARRVDSITSGPSLCGASLISANDCSLASVDAGFGARQTFAEDISSVFGLHDFEV
jgi:hypothetical protein